MKYTSLLIIVALGVFACQKKSVNYKIEGTVTDQSFSQPLSGATVQLYQVPAGTSGGSEILATTTTGSDGKYQFEFKREKIEKYTVKISKLNYFTATKDFTQEDLTPEKTNAFSHATTAKAWVKLHFVNTDADTDLKYIRQQGKQNCEECCASSEQFLYGAVDESIYCVNDANTAYAYYYWVLNSMDNGPMSIVTPAFDTVELLLNY
jgi:hypothetical protein